MDSVGVRPSSTIRSVGDEKVARLMPVSVALMDVGKTLGGRQLILA